MFFKAILFAAVALAQVPVPPLKTRVTDLTGTLQPQQSSALEQTLAEFESRKGSQIAVLLVRSTQPETAFDYGVRVFDAWKLGRKGDYAEGAVRAIEAITALLAQHFPPRGRNPNELPDKPVVL